MVNRLPLRVRHAWLIFVVTILATSFLASLPGAEAASPNYVLGGVVQFAPANVTVELFSSGTHAIYTAKTTSSGYFQFNASNTNSQLGPGWWGLWVPPQSFHAIGPNCATGSSVCAALPGVPAPQYYFESATALTPPGTPRNIGSVNIVGFNTQISGLVKFQGVGAAGAVVELLSPNYPNFPLQSNLTNASGNFRLAVSTASSWLIYTVAGGSPGQNQFNYTPISPPFPPSVTINIVPNHVTGLISNPNGSLVLTGLNQTLIDTTAGANLYDVYSQYLPTGPVYNIGTYTGNFLTGGTETFDATVAPLGYAPAFLSLSVSASNRAGISPNPHPVTVTPIAPPGVFNTTLNFSSGAAGNYFGLLNVQTVATLGNYSVFPELPNASVGQLWAQLALDFAGSLSLPSATFSGTVAPWILSQGPFFPAGQNAVTINGTGFGQPTNATNPVAPCATVSSTNFACTAFPPTATLTTGNGLAYSWSQKYNVTGLLPKRGTAGSYNILFNFRHPTSGQSINYTVILPTGYILKANNPVPSNARLAPAGPQGTWSKFTLVSLPSSSPIGSANLTIVRGGGVAARADVSVPNFTFSSKNVINSSRTNYQVIIGSGQNASFSALNSTYPAGTNGSLFHWIFGDSGSVTTFKAVTHHVYASHGPYTANLTVTSSGQLTNSVTFTVYVGDQSPTAAMAVNGTLLSAGGTPYYIVNWSNSLQFNATGSASTLYSGAPVPGVLSDSVWTFSSYNYTKEYNFSVGAGANFLTNVTYSFLGAGHYFNSTPIAGVSGSFFGWEYNVTLTVWDGQGHSASLSRFVLVRDTEKPVPVILALGSNGKSIPSSGIVEGPGGFVAVTLSGVNSSDPHNGTVVAYNWSVTNKANSSFNMTSHNQIYKLNIPASTSPYKVGLKVTDRAGNVANNTLLLTVAPNATTRPILSAGNLTVVGSPSSLTDGSTYHVFVNITNTGGKSSTGQNLRVLFYLTSPSGSGSPIFIGATVSFYNVTSGGAIATSPWLGTVNLAHNQSVRAEISWTPARVGNYWLWANATCNNCYVSGPNLVHISVTLAQNPVVTYEEYGAIAAGAVVVIVLLIMIYRRRARAAQAPRGGGGRLERGAGRDEEEEEDEGT